MYYHPQTCLRVAQQNLGFIEPILHRGFEIVLLHHNRYGTGIKGDV